MSAATEDQRIPAGPDEALAVVEAAGQVPGDEVSLRLGRTTARAQAPADLPVDAQDVGELEGDPVGGVGTGRPHSDEAAAGGHEGADLGHQL